MGHVPEMFSWRERGYKNCLERSRIPRRAVAAPLRKPETLSPTMRCKAFVFGCGFAFQILVACIASPPWLLRLGKRPRLSPPTEPEAVLDHPPRVAEWWTEYRGSFHGPLPAVFKKAGESEDWTTQAIQLNMFQARVEALNTVRQ